MKITLFALVCAGMGAVFGVAMARVQLGEGTTFRLPDATAPTSGNSEQPMPRVSVDSETYDFGQMERRAANSHDFLFTNVGDAPLQLTVGDTTCKCTVGEAPEGVVEPGETVPVTLNWTASTPESTFRQNATIHTNDPLRQTVRLTVEGKVIDASSYHPKSLSFGNVNSGTSKSAEVKIVSFRDEAFEVTGTELIAPASDEHFAVEIEELPPEEYPTPDVLSGRRVKVTARPSLPFGRIRGWLRIRTTLPTIPAIELPLDGKVVSDLSVIGQGYDTDKDVLRLGAVVGSKGAERELHIFLRGERGMETDLEIQETFPKFLEAELGERKPGKTFVQVPLVIRVPPGSPPAVHLGGQGSEAGRVVIATTHPQVPEVVVRVRFTVE